jgi:predicted aspartyl protease
LACAAWCAACAHAPPPFTTRLVVERSEFGSKAFVRASVAGKPMKLLLDTGAPRSLVSARFARANHLVMASDAFDETLIDSNGRMFRLGLVRSVPVQFESGAAPGAIDFIVNPFLAADEAIVVPQDLISRGRALVIDIEGEQLRVAREEEVLAPQAGAAPFVEVEFRGCRTESFFEKSHRVVSASINGVPASMLVDTGASLTTLSRNNPALPSMKSTAGKIGFTAGMMSVGNHFLVEGVPVGFANTAFVVRATVSPASSPCWHGALGADLLRHCTLVWGYSSLWARCHAPAAGE